MFQQISLSAEIRYNQTGTTYESIVSLTKPVCPFPAPSTELVPLPLIPYIALCLNTHLNTSIAMVLLLYLF